jgi:hypothetical protein
MLVRGFVFAVVLESFRNPSLNGARMPSIADDVATDRSTPRSRFTESRRCGFDDESLALMG